MKVPVKSGDWSASDTWGTITDEANFLLLDNNSDVDLTITTEYAEAFTAPNTTNAATHIITAINGSISSTDVNHADVVVVLEEYNGSTWSEVASGRFNTSDINDSTTFINFESLGFLIIPLESVYQFTTTNTGYYRCGIRLENVTGTVNALDVELNNAAAGRVVYAVDDRNAVPGSTEDVIILGPVGGQYAVKVTGSQSCGSDQALNESFTANGEITVGVMVANAGKLHFDQTADSTLTIKGSFFVMSGGTFEMGTPASPMPAGIKATIALDQTMRDYYFGNNSDNGANISMVGQAKPDEDNYVSVIISGDGTTGNPLILTDPVDWDVDDEIALLPGTNDSTNYNQTEYKFIKIKNSATSYVLSDTKGGAESALTYAHSNAHAVNIERNVVIEALGTSNEVRPRLGWNGSSDQINFSDSRLVMRWVKLKGRTQAFSVILSNNSKYLDDNTKFDFQFIAYEGYDQGFAFPYADSLPFTFKGILAYKSPENNTYGVGAYDGTSNKIIDKAIVFDVQSTGVSASAANILYKDCIVAGANKGYGSTAAGLQFSTSLAQAIVQGLDCYACRRSIFHGDRGSGVELFNCDFGVRFNNQNAHGSGYSNTATLAFFTNCRFGSNLGDLAEIGLTGSINKKMGFQNHQGILNNNITNSGDGFLSLTGAGLGDTTVRTAGSFAMKMQPTYGQIQKLQFLVLARANSAISILGYAKRNSNLNSDVTISIRLPGSGIPSSTVSLKAGTDWQLFSLSADYDGDSNTYATVEISVPYDASGGAVYFDDFLNGGNIITGLDLWYQGRPSLVLYNELGNPKEVWDVVASGFAEATTGKLLDNTRKGVEDAQALIFAK